MLLLRLPGFGLLIASLLPAFWVPVVVAFVPWTTPIRNVVHVVKSASNADLERQDLLEKAARLRREASELESKLSPSSRRSAEVATAKPEVTYKTISDSVWTFSYRFSNQPESKDEDSKSKRNFYSGKLTLKMKSDGYTDILNHEQGNSPLEITKAWGWDVERSNDDDKDYLLFSVDANVPEVGRQRFYFQAMQEVSGAGFIWLKEGTVTVKQDIVDAKSTPGMWGLFSPRGILAQFRLVGNFVAKPT